MIFDFLVWTIAWELGAFGCSQQLGNGIQALVLSLVNNNIHDNDKLFKFLYTTVYSLFMRCKDGMEGLKNEFTRKIQCIWASMQANLKVAVIT